MFEISSCPYSIALLLPVAHNDCQEGRERGFPAGFSKDTSPLGE